MRIPEERYFEASDGVRLFYRYWPPAAAVSKQALVLLHRGHEHSGRLQHLVDELDLPDFAMFAWDARGHGRSAEVGAAKVSIGLLIKDVDAFVGHISRSFEIPIQ